MGKNKLLLFSFFILFSFLFLKKIFINNMSLFVISSIELDEVVNNRKKYTDNIDLYYKGKEIPFVLSDNYYLFSSNSKNDYFDIINIDGFNIGLFSTDEEHLSIIAYNDKYYKFLDVVLTSLPVISINDDNTFLTDIYSSMILFEPSDNSTIVNSYNINYRIRGESSSLTDKKSYRINVVNNNKKKNVSLLNMSYDDDWILNPLVFDNSFIREKIAYDIWNSLSDLYQHHLEYVELIVDNDYRGLYCLQEIVDLDTFNATKNDLLVSTKFENELVVDSKLDDESFVLNSFVIDEFEIEEGIKDKKLILDILRSFKNNLEDKKTDIKIEYDLNNSASYNLFINLILAEDNNYKNQKILFKNNNSFYTVVRTVWDLDCIFNNELVDKGFKVDEWYDDYAVPSDVRDSFSSFLKDKYLNIRKNIYNEKDIYELIDKYENILMKSGAIERNSKRWNGNYSGTSFIKAFFKDRIDFLDNYFGVDCNGI